MHIRFLAALLTLCLPLAVQPSSVRAQDLPLISDGVTRVDGDALIVATCRAGEGCHCYQSNYSLSTLQTQIGVDPPEGVANPILIRAEDRAFWSADSGHAVDLVYGGDGLCDPQVFNAAETGLPRNGLWEMTVTGHELSGCPAQVATAIAGEVVVGQSERRSISWPRPFSMSPLTADNPVAGPWVNRGGGVWYTEIINVGGEAGGNARVTMTARIISPTEIAMTNVFSADVLAVLTGEACRSTTHAAMRLRG